MKSNVATFVMADSFQLAEHGKGSSAGPSHAALVLMTNERAAILESGIRNAAEEMQQARRLTRLPVIIGTITVSRTVVARGLPEAWP